MKKLLGILACAAMVLGLAGCTITPESSSGRNTSIHFLSWDEVKDEAMYTEDVYNTAVDSSKVSYEVDANNVVTVTYNGTDHFQCTWLAVEGTYTTLVSFAEEFQTKGSAGDYLVFTNGEKYSEDTVNGIIDTANDCKSFSVQLSDDCDDVTFAVCCYSK